MLTILLINTHKKSGAALPHTLPGPIRPRRRDGGVSVRLCCQGSRQVLVLVLEPCGQRADGEREKMSVRVSVNA